MPLHPGMGHRRRVVAAMVGTSVLSTLLVGRSARCDEEPTTPVAAEVKPAATARVYPHLSARRYDLGDGPRSYWLFEPDEPKPERAAVVVFLHGWFAVNPAFYGAWIDHLVRGGLIVIFPRYQNDVGTLPCDFLPNAISSIRDALDVLEGGVKHVRPDLKRFALIGHSAGGNLAAQIAALASDPHSGLPLPRAVVALMPGEVFPTRQPSLDQIDPKTLLLVAVGEDDLLVGDLRGRQIFVQAGSIPRARKRFLLYRSDRHGFPPIVAEHTAPTGSNRRLDTGEGIFRTFQLSLAEVNALDCAGFWRITESTLDAAFAGKSFEEAVTDEAQFTHLGYWSDGRKVTPPLIGDDLSSIPRVILPNGIRVIPWELPSRIGDSSRADADTRFR
jgi:acetyl esterase/lipase